ncbi:hypothetical protein WT61_14580 [Burkholderia stagnalis]|nr:hypothetical protein WT61_14580 [Burkholderia stagnalis]KWH39552.1 hypothetical protein WT62_23485 [Burkholderia stagnalis]
MRAGGRRIGTALDRRLLGAAARLARARAKRRRTGIARVAAVPRGRRAVMPVRLVRQRRAVPL